MDEVSQRISVNQAELNLRALAKAVSESGARYIIEHDGKPLAAIVGMAELKLIERMCEPMPQERADALLSKLENIGGSDWTDEDYKDWVDMIYWASRGHSAFED